MELIKQEVLDSFTGVGKRWDEGAGGGEELSRRVHCKLLSSGVRTPGISEYAPARGRASWLAGDTVAAMCELNNDRGIPTLLSERIPSR